jgi:uncharacterized repeat protein (TIGR03943 family)
MALWSGVFAWLWLSGEMTRYLGPRTYWVAPFGALALVGAAAVTAAGARRASDRTRLSARDAFRFGVILLPLVAMVAVPGAQLGSQAAANKAPAGILVGAAAAVPGAPGSGPVGFRDIYYAGQSEGYALERGISAGMSVRLTGFITHPPDIPEGYFALTRFYVSCCAADAIPYSVTVDPPGPFVPRAYPDDRWLEIRGQLVQMDTGFTLTPHSIRPVKTPDDPYLY